ncbi:MAG: ComEC/Rec2 family competence protein [Rickettsiales bacterium]|nr:ComEC/Rec2 family competence protein [Rickettsiales bacterium]
MRDWKQNLEIWLLEEQSRWLLWVPIAMACGIITYFAWVGPPPDYLGAALIAAGAPTWVFWKRMPWVRGLLLVFFFAGVGFVATQWQMQRFQQSLISRPSAVLPLFGTIQEVINDESGKQKLVLGDVEVEGGSRYPLPNTIRLSLKKINAHLLAGQRVKLRGGLFPLPPPALPGGFDFTRHFYFKGIGAVGFGLNPVEILSTENEQNWQIDLANFRVQLGKKIAAVMRPHFSQATVAISTALITGERAGIPEETKEAMRAAGLAHMLAISGLHLGLVCGVFFILLRYIFVLIPGAALRFPVKKWAALGCVLGGFAYLTIAGFPVSAQRAYAMVALVFIAIMLERQVLPMRSLALAAILVLFIAPSSLMGPSFQLSFSATMSIIALYEVWRRKRAEREIKGGHYGWSQKLMIYLGGVLATTFVASAITSPYAVYHFNQFTNYHLLANMAASPIFSFIVMPAAVGGMLTMPFGWEAPFLWLMGQGVEWVAAIATAIAALPDAMIHVPTPPLWALVVVSLGACWLCLWQQRIRHLGWLVILIGLVPFFTVRLPDILISEKAEQVAVKLESGGYAMLRGSVRNFKAGLWQEALGIEEFAKADTFKESYRCDGFGCILDYKGKQIAFPKRRIAAIEDCESADAMITSFYVDCESAVVVERPKQATSLTIDREITLRQARAFTARLSAQD